jgi:hypothetical protein
MRLIDTLFWRLWLVETPPLALHVVEPQGPIESLPQVRVLHWHHLAEEFPPPTVGSPFRQTIADPLPDVIAASHQCHLGRLVERFQRPDESKQVEPFAGEVGLGVIGFKPLRPITGPQHELPLTAALGTVNVGEQQEVWCREVHRCLTYIGVREDQIVVNLRRMTQTENVFR